MASQASGLSSLWPPNGVLLGLLIVAGRDRGDRVALVLGAIVGNLCFSFYRHHPLPLLLLFPAANIIEATGAAMLVRAFGGIMGAFERTRDVLSFAAACMIAPLFSAAIGAIAMYYAFGTEFRQAMIDWYGAASLSLAIISPAVIVIARFRETASFDDLSAARVGESLLILGLVASATVLIFYGSRLPILFMILPFILLATFRLRQFGAIASVIIVAGISARATALGYGPIAVHGGPQIANHMLLVQFFVAVNFLTALPVAAALTQSDRRGNEAHLIADHFKMVVENIGEVIFRTDRKGRWTYLNPAWQTLTGHDIVESQGRSWLDWVEESERIEFRDWAQPVLDGEVPSTRRLLRFRMRNGDVRWIELSIQAVRDTGGHAIGTTGTLRDIDDRKKLEEHVMSAKRRAEEQAREATLLASTDELTGLANRRAYLRHLDRQVEAANEFGRALAVAIFDVDHFKLVNDSHGHAVGDRVLQIVSDRSVAVVRSGDLVGRLGGEEFAILMPGASLEDAAAVAERLRSVIAQPAESGEDLLPTVTVSIGIAAHAYQDTAGDLLAGADRALYAAKSAGRNRVTVSA